MKREDAEEFTQSLGQIVGGSYRQIALAKRLGVPKALGMSVPQWVNEHLGGYARLSAEDRRQIVKELAAEGESNRAIAQVIGVDESTVREDKRAGNPAPAQKKAGETSTIDSGGAGNPALSESPLDAATILATDEKTKTTAKATAKRQENEDKRKADLARSVEVNLPAGLHHGDFRELAVQIADNSAQLVFTDPPYDDKSVSLYGDAAEIAARILKPGGSFIAYSGQRHLPAVLSACGEHLRYWWTVAGVHSGGAQILNKLGIRCGWKPLVWFVKDTRGDVQNILRDVVTGNREKDAHEWQQAEAEAAYYIEHLTTPDGLVVDFFLGGGTTAVAAERLGRQWIGFEINAASAERASERLRKAAV